MERTSENWVWLTTGLQPSSAAGQRHVGHLTLNGAVALGNDCKQCAGCVTRKLNRDEKLGQAVGCGQCTEAAQVQVFLRREKGRMKMRVGRVVRNT